MAKAANTNEKPGMGGHDFDETREQIHRQMLAAVSHDLKTPLATIIGSLEIHNRMAQKLSAEKKDALIASALTEAYRLDNFITNILDMAKLEGGMVTIKPEPCDFPSLLQDCLIRLGPKRHHGTISLHADTAVRDMQADLMLLGRAIGLVLENAIKYGGKKPDIMVTYGQHGNEVYVRVRDHGPGIPEDKKEQIFSKYTRFAKADHQNAGTGLGLAICREIMRLLRGNVEAANHPEGGALFSLTLPSR